MNFSLVLYFSFIYFICNTYINNLQLNNSIMKYERSFHKGQDSVRIGYENYKLIGYLTKVNCSHENIGGNLEECLNWTFKEEALSNLLTKMKRVEAIEAYSRCYDYSCWYEGKVTDGIELYEIVIYGGGEITLNTNNKIIHFIMEDESNLFIEICNCCEDD